MTTRLDRPKRGINDDRLIRFLEEATTASRTAFRPAVIILAPQEIPQEKRERDRLEDATWEDAAFY